MIDFIKKYSYCFYEQNNTIIDILNLAPNLYNCFEIPDQPGLLNWDRMHYRKFDQVIVIDRNFYTLEGYKTTTGFFDFKFLKERDYLNELIDNYLDTTVEIFQELANGLGINKDVNVDSLTYIFIKYYQRIDKTSLPQMGTHADNKTFSIINSTHPGLVSRDSPADEWLPLFKTPNTSVILLGTQQSLYPAREHMVNFFHSTANTRYSFIVFF